MIPEPGFYYHYKHDSANGIFNYAYEVLNIGHHTEISDWKEGEMVVYRPVYEEAKVYSVGRHWDVRPRVMFLESKIINGETIPRFQKITDQEIIFQLEKKRNEMYKN